MQTVSWDEVCKLIDGIPYDIDFDKDFSAITLDGEPITEIPIASIIEGLEVQAETHASYIHYAPSANSYPSSHDLCIGFEKYTEKQLKQEQKWKKGRKKRIAKGERILKKIENREWR